MNALIISISSLIIYYVGLSYVTKESFKKRKIKISPWLMLVIPSFIIKTYVIIAYRNISNVRMVKRILLDLFLGYNSGLAILVEIIDFGLQNNLIGNVEVRKNVSLSEKFKNIWNKKIKGEFSDSLDNYLFC